ncbi:hypothetical protein [Kosakonia cowanii]|uniref:hypothetical protein n=1 Tax=Kosakonia cowanii TaxID=208223 RepID=UPI0028A7ADDB|nr:hypothetical protein [Kosakonia cowanii]
MNMDKAIILALLLGFSSASGAAFAGQCPAKGSITSTGVETDTDGISSMVIAPHPPLTVNGKDSIPWPS